MYTKPTLYFGEMNQQHKITISGVVFYVEEECHKYLKEKMQFFHVGNTNVTDERIAELLLEELREDGKSVVCTKMVEHLMEKTKHLR